MFFFRNGNAQCKSQLEVGQTRNIIKLHHPQESLNYMVRNMGGACNKNLILKLKSSSIIVVRQLLV